MSELVDKFIEETKTKKKEQLMAIAIDLQYWKTVVGGTNIDKLRKELSTEQKNLVKSAKGQVIKDGRNMERISELTVEIDNLEKANGEITRLTDMDASIRVYLDSVASLPASVKKDLEDIAKLAPFIGKGGKA